MSLTREITVYPATIGSLAPKGVGITKIRRVAAYARVSTDSEEQLSSYDAQVKHYSKFIQENVAWEFVEVYADEGISATSTKKRDGFNRMISDALEGKIDLIVTKSVSRFARNTVDTLTTVRNLKECGVEVYFEKENIYTLDSKGELLITIMSSLAQEESRSISENVTWGQRKRFADGKVSLPYKIFLGFEKGEDGQPKIVDREAKVVRLIYKLYLEGMTPTVIASQLTNEGILTPSGKKVWNSTTISSILQNEKYKGDAMLQKSFTVDFLTKKTKINEGEVPQYYVEHSHPAIVSPEVYNLAQLELKKRKGNKGYKTCGSCFSGKIICGECGSIYGSKVWHSTSKYKRTIWQCNSKFKNGKKCGTPHIYENSIKAAFVAVFNSLISNKEQILADFTEIIASLMDTIALEKENSKFQTEIDVLLELLRKSVDENARTAINQADYEKSHNALLDRFEATKSIKAEVEEKLKERLAKGEEIRSFMKKLEESEKSLTDFDEELWNAVVVRVAVGDGGVVRFEFKNGQEVE